MKKHFLSMIIVITMVIGMIPMTAMTASAASKTEINGETYFEISTAEDLIWFAQLVNGTNPTAEQNTSANAILLNNIVLNENVLKADGSLNGGDFNQWTPIGSYDHPYEGTFDGNGKTVKGIYIDAIQYNQGLVGYNNGTVKNVTVADSYINSMGANIGGVVGYNNGTVEDCFNYATVRSYEADYYATNLGGVVGVISKGIVQRCANYGKVIGGYEISQIGGVVGGLYGGSVTDCYNHGEVRSEVGKEVGGVAGSITNRVTLSNSYTIGDVGCCGSVRDGTVINSYYLSETETDDIDGTVAKTAEQFASGEVAYLLNGDQSKLSFGQSLMGNYRDDFPVFATASNHVYQSTGDDGTTVVYVNELASSAVTVYTIYFDDGVNSTELDLRLTNISCDGTVEKRQDPTTKLWTVKITFPHEEECVGTHNFTVFCTADCCCVEMAALADGATYKCENAVTELEPENPEFANVVAWNDTDNNGEINEGETTYTSLAQALNAGGTVKMYRDYDVGEEGRISIDKTNVTLDLNGKSVTWREAENTIFDIRNVEMTIRGNGNITSTMNSEMGPSVAISVDNGKLILDGGTIESPYYAIEMHSGEMIVNGGKIQTDGLSVQRGVCTINGGTISNLNNYGTCVINGGTFIGSLYVSGQMTVLGGSFRNDPSSWVAEGYETTRNSSTGFYDVTPIMYPIIFGTTENGSVVSNVAEAGVGEIVALTVTPVAHYQLNTILITDQNGTPVALDENNSFVMPIGGVTVAATFAAIDYATQADFTDSLEKLNKAIEELNEAMENENAELSDLIARLNTALTNAKTALEEADAENKNELLSKIEAGDNTLNEAVKTAQKNLDLAKEELTKAIANGDQALDGKITALNEALAAANAAFEAASLTTQSELTTKINEAQTALQEAINALAKEVDSLKQTLENKGTELDSLKQTLENRDTELDSLKQTLANKGTELDHLKQTLENKNAGLEEKDSELQTFIVIVCVVSGVAFCGCGALAAWTFIERKKKTAA